jgi:hypothetical protein
MQNGKSKLLQAARRVRDEIYSTVKAQLLDETRTYQEIANTNGFLWQAYRDLRERSEFQGRSGHARGVHRSSRRGCMTEENRIPTFVLEDLLFQRRLQRNLNAELERLNNLLVTQVTLPEERKQLLAEVHEAIQKRWDEEGGFTPHSGTATEEARDE